MSQPPDSPYAPPRSSLGGEASSPTAGQIATAGQRLANFAIDTAAVYALYALVAFTFNALGVTPAFVQAHANGLAPVVLAIPIVYRTVCEAFWGRTLGKLVTGTRVVSARGGAPSIAQVLGRSFARMIPFEALSFFGGNGRPVGLHDLFSRTRVIRIR